MKRANHLFLYCMILFVGGIVLFLYWLVAHSPQRISAEYATVLVSYQTPTPRLTVNSQTSTKTPTPMSMSHVPPEATPVYVSDEKNDRTISYNQLRVKLLDLLNESIPDGAIEIQKNTYIVVNGNCVIDCSEIQYPAQLYASSDGYQSATYTVQASTPNDIIISLDYHCNYELTVFTDQKRKYRAAAAEVVIYHVQAAPRPIPSRIMVPISYEYADPFEIVRHDGDLVLKRCTRVIPLVARTRIPGGGRYIAPLAGDHVMAVGACSWTMPGSDQHTKKMTSSKVRILDTLAFAAYGGRDYERITLRRAQFEGVSFLQFLDIHSL